MDTARSGDGWAWDPARRTFDAPHASVRLSPREAAILERLIAAGGAPVGRDDLEPDGGREVDFVVRRMRKKIERDPSDPRLLRTVHGVGYQFGRTPVPAAAAPPPSERLVMGDSRIDLELGLVERFGAERTLTPHQRAILAALIEASGRPVHEPHSPAGGGATAARPARSTGWCSSCGGCSSPIRPSRCTC
ncbi:MAG: helix-turn-helix domain-containing protein [Myxococcota bacterium]